MFLLYPRNKITDWSLSIPKGEKLMDLFLLNPRNKIMDLFLLNPRNKIMDLFLLYPRNKIMDLFLLK